MHCSNEREAWRSGGRREAASCCPVSPYQGTILDGHNVCHYAPACFRQCINAGSGNHCVHIEPMRCTRVTSNCSIAHSRADDFACWHHGLSWKQHNAASAGPWDNAVNGPKANLDEGDKHSSRRQANGMLIKPHEWACLWLTRVSYADFHLK